MKIEIGFEILNADFDDDMEMEDDYITVDCYKQVKDIAYNWICSHEEHKGGSNPLGDDCHVFYAHASGGGTVYENWGETDAVDNCPCVDCDK